MTENVRELIYRDEAIEVAREAAYNWDGSYDLERDKLICELIKGIPAVNYGMEQVGGDESSKDIEHWIPVEAELPAQNTKVIITDAAGDVYSVNYFRDGLFEGCKHYPVIAWMPLPDPYKECE